MATYPNDPYKEEDWPQGYDQLSYVSLLLICLCNYIICIHLLTEWHTTTLSAGQIDKETLYSRTSINKS